MKNIQISIEGIVGSGKSTLLNLVDKWKGVNIIHEPIDKWIDVGGVNLLQNFYSDMKRWAFQFQTFALLTFLENDIIMNGITISERCFLSAM